MSATSIGISISFPQKRPSHDLSSVGFIAGPSRIHLPAAVSSLSIRIGAGSAVPSTTIRMGGGPRTYPGGVSKWQWKRMQEKKAKQLLKARLCRERQIYEMRKRAELRAAVAELERPWEVVERAPTLFSVKADEQVKALADRFQRPGGFDLWSARDGPQLFDSPDELPSARVFPKGAVHSLKPYGIFPASERSNSSSDSGGKEDLPHDTDKSRRSRRASGRRYRGRMGAEGYSNGSDSNTEVSRDLTNWESREGTWMEAEAQKTEKGAVLVEDNRRKPYGRRYRGRMDGEGYVNGRDSNTKVASDLANWESRDGTWMNPEAEKAEIGAVEVENNMEKHYSLRYRGRMDAEVYIRGSDFNAKVSRDLTTSGSREETWMNVEAEKNAKGAVLIGENGRKHSGLPFDRAKWKGAARRDSERNSTDPGMDGGGHTNGAREKQIHSSGKWRNRGNGRKDVPRGLSG